jgi:phosphoribosylglycinamide formyltransferase-1
MYGRFVHEAVLNAGDEVTGITIHLVDEDYDTGAIVNQCTLPVHKDDTVGSISARVLEAEHEFLVETLAKMSLGAL